MHCAFITAWGAGDASFFNFKKRHEVYLVFTWSVVTGQVIHAHVPLLPSSIIWYRQKLRCKQAHHTMCLWSHSISWLRATETEISAALWVLVAREGLYVYFFLHYSVVNIQCRWCMPSVLWHCWLGGRKGIRPLKTERWGAGVVICLEQGADCLRMVQLMPRHLPSSLALFKSRLVLAFWYQLNQVVLEKRLLNGCSSSSSWCMLLYCLM